MNLQQKYQEICTHIPENGVSLDQLKEVIALITSYHREETLVHHIKMMERLGFIMRKDLAWYSKYQYPKRNEIKPVKQNIAEGEKSPEKEADEFLEKFKGGKVE